MTFTHEFMIMILDSEDELVKLILEDSHLYNSVIMNHDGKNSTLVHYCAEFSNCELLEYLILEKGMPVDIEDSQGKTPLMKAMEEFGAESERSAEFLLKAGADICYKSDLGFDMMFIAFDSCPVECVLSAAFGKLREKYPSCEELAERLITDNNCKINRAVYSRDVELVKCMLDRGISVSDTDPERSATPALHVAVAMHDPEMVRLLLQHGADPEENDNGTALFYLYSSDHEWHDQNPDHDHDRLTILNLLISRKVSLTSLKRHDQFNVMNVLKYGSREVIRTILQSCTDFTVKGRDGATLLHHIAYNKKPGIAEELKHHIDKFDINASYLPFVDIYGHRRTALEISSKTGNVNTVKLLLDHKAQPSIGLLVSLYSIWPTANPDLDYSIDQCTELILYHIFDPEIIFTVRNYEQKLLVDVALEHKYFNRINMALAQLAMLQEMGIAMDEKARLKLESFPQLKTYLDKCRLFLRKIIGNSVSVFELIVGNDKGIARYLNNDEFLIKCTRLCRKQWFKSSYKYYHKIIQRRISKVIRRNMLKNRAARIISKISAKRFGPINIAMEKIINCLNDQDLRNLHQL